MTVIDFETFNTIMYYKIKEIMCDDSIDEENKGCIIETMINDAIVDYLSGYIMNEQDREVIAKRKRDELVESINESFGLKRRKVMVRRD